MDGYGAHTYGDAMADTYDAWYDDRPDTDAAVATLASLAARPPGGRVLELGIGSGRLALPLAARGLEVWGIDASVAMVDRLRAKPGGDRIPVAIGDMSCLELHDLPRGADARFGLVFVAINTIFNLTTREAQVRCFSRVAERLGPGGRFVVEAFVPTVDRPTNLVEARTVALDHVILTASRHDPERQMVECQVIEIRESGIRLRPLTLRYAPPQELDSMAAAAKLRLAERWSDWHRTPFSPGDGVHVTVYERR
jgi:SAM-dependent methyltransferase